MVQDSNEEKLRERSKCVIMQIVSCDAKRKDGKQGFEKRRKIKNGYAYQEMERLRKEQQAGETRVDINVQLQE